MEVTQVAYDFNSLTKQADEAINRDKFYTDFEDVDQSKLHQISELTEWLRTKGKGSDVREVIAQLFERTWLENIKEGNANMEVAKARGTYDTLPNRLQAIDGKISQTTTDITRTESRIDGLIANAGNGTVPSELTDIRVDINGLTYPTAGQAVREQFKKALKGDIQIYSAEVLKAPYDDLNTLPINSIVLYSHYGNVANKPDPNYTGGVNVQTTNYSLDSRLGASQILTQADGTMYYRGFWRTKDGVDKWTRWNRVNTDTNGLAGDRKIYAPEVLIPPYDDLNTLPVNTIVLYSYPHGVSNMPSGVGGGATVLTYNYAGESEISGAVQILTASNGDIYTRNFWGLPGKDTWNTWQKIVTEKDLSQNIDTDPFQPSLALFEKIGVIGDSYASGEIYPGGIPDDKYSVSWGQILARKNGVTCTNFSRGGLTTRSWLTDNMGLSKLNSSEPQNLYYISLGINEDYKMGTGYIGTEADMDSGADTFYGNYAKIIKAVQAKAPYAKIIIIDYAWAKSDTDPYFVATKNIATKFGLPLIKHRDDGFLSSDKFKHELMEYGHPVAISYAAMASAFEKLTIKAIRDNIAYFKDYRG